jgi:hypothetical protein
LEGHSLIDSNQMGSREGDAGDVVDSLHGSKGSRMIRNKSNREGGGEKKPARDSLWPSLATARRVSAFPCSCVARITGERAEVVIKVLVHKSECIQIVVGRLIVWTAISIGLRKLTTNALPPASTNRRKLSRVSER